MRDCYCLKHTPGRINEITSMQIARQPEYDKPIFAKARVAKLQYTTTCHEILGNSEPVKRCPERAEYLITMMTEGV